MRLPLIAAILASALALGSAAAAGDAGCRSSVDIDVDETPFDPPLAKVVFAEVFRAVERSDIGCEDVAGTRLSLTRVTIHWIDADHAALEVEVADGDEHRAMGRGVALVHVDRDARALAITIATTEMIEELRAQVRLARPAPAPPSPSAPPSVPPRELLSTPAAREQRWSVVPTLALDAFTRGLALLGPDTRLLIPLYGPLRANVRFGTRAALGADTPTSAFVAGGAVELAWAPRRARHELTVGARLDAFSVPFEGAQRLYAVAGLDVGGALRLGPATSLVVDAGIGRALERESGDRGPLAGVGISASAGVALAF